MYHIVRPSTPVSAATASGGSVSLSECASLTPRHKAEHLARLGWQCQQKPAPNEALAHYREALALLETLDVRAHWNVVVPVQNNLASVLRELGKYRDAEGCYVQAINLLENCTGGAERSTLSGLYGNLASLYHAVGISDAALRMQEKCVALLEECRTTRPGELYSALKTLATLCHKVGNDTSAKEILAKANEMLGMSSLPKNPPKSQQETRVIYRRSPSRGE